MNKQVYAALANSNDKAMAALSTKTKQPSMKGNKVMTYQKIDAGNGNRTIETKCGKFLASLFAGSEGNYQLVSLDFSVVINFNSEPDLKDCLPFL